MMLAKHQKRALYGFKMHRKDVTQTWKLQNTID
jgi:hypothetical protein